MDHMSLKLSVIVPVYNEAGSLHVILSRVVRAPFTKEIIVVDDGSCDRTIDILRDKSSLDSFLSGHAAAPFQTKVLFHDRNRGKGAAIRTALETVTGDVVLVQDADLEYDPEEYPRLLAPILEGKADVVYGTRFLGSTHRVLYFWHTVGNRILTLISNMFTDLNLTDMEVGYKAFKTEILQKITLRSNRFDFEPEITARIARRGVRIYEVPISYAGRTYAEGKKINWKDGFHAIGAIVRYNLWDVEPKGSWKPSPSTAALALDAHQETMRGQDSRSCDRSKKLDQLEPADRVVSSRH
jgi:glycosyltransferase involved in cell wall biosynthesis